MDRANDSIIVAQPKEAIAEFVSARQGQVNEWGDYTALGLIRGGVLVAGVIYNHFSGPNILMHVGAVPGRQWLNRRFLFAAFDYPFNQLGCRRVTGLVPKRNKVARKFDEHLGFVYEGNMQHALPDDDLIVYGLLREKCKWITTDFLKRYGQA